MVDIGVILCGMYDFYTEIMKFLQFLQKWLIFGTFLQRVEILVLPSNSVNEVLLSYTRVQKV